MEQKYYWIIGIIAVIAIILISGCIQEEPATPTKLDIKNIPAGGELIPVSYSFIYPNVVPGFTYGGHDDYLLSNNTYGPIRWLGMEKGNIEKVEKISYPRLTFVRYLLKNSQKVSIQDSSKIVYSGDSIICFKGQVPGTRKNPIVDVFYCFAQDENKLFLTESKILNDGKDFLLTYLSGRYSREYDKYLPSIKIILDLKKQLNLTECSIMHDQHRYTRSCVGGDTTKCKKLDINVNRSKLGCRVDEEGLEGLYLVATTVDEKSKMDVLLEEVYDNELRDKELRNLDMIHISKEGQLILWYSKPNSISILKQNGKTVLSLNLRVRQHQELAKKPSSFDDLVSKMEKLGKKITFSDIEISQIQIYRGGSGILTGIYEFW